MMKIVYWELRMLPERPKYENLASLAYDNKGLQEMNEFAVLSPLFRQKHDCNMGIL